MIRKHSVGFKELTAGRVGSQRRKNFVVEKTSRAVARVHYYFHARERFIGLQRRRNFSAQIFGVKICQRKFFRVRHAAADFVASRRQLQNGSDVRFFQTALSCKKFHAVAVEGQMTCRQHD